MTGALNLDAAFSALADPTRRAILARLAKGEATVMEKNYDRLDDVLAAMTIKTKPRQKGETK